MDGDDDTALLVAGGGSSGATPSYTLYTVRFSQANEPRPGELTLGNWDLGGTVSAWSYAHADELFPAGRLVPGRPALTLEDDLPEAPIAIEEELRSGLVESAVALRHGRIAYHGPTPANRPRLLMSVSKVVPSLLIGILVDQGIVDYANPISEYLPQLGQQWDGCRLLDVLDMASGVACPEVGDSGAYLDPKHPFFQFEASLGWRPQTRPDSPFELALSYDRVGQPGTAYDYTSVNTFLLAWVIETVTGDRFTEVVQQRVWDQLALTRDAAWAVNDAGTAVAHGGLIMSTEDLARFGTVFTPSGGVLGHDLVVPASYMGVLRRPRSFRAPWTPAHAWPAGQWNWVTTEGDMFKSGFGGQGLFISPTRDVVIAFTGTPGADGTTNHLGRMCQEWADSLTR